MNHISEALRRAASGPTPKRRKAAFSDWVEYGSHAWTSLIAHRGWTESSSFMGAGHLTQRTFLLIVAEAVDG